MSELPIKSSELRLDQFGKQVINSILDKVDKARQTNERMTVITLDQLKSNLTKDEIDTVNAVYGLNPKQYGFGAPKVGLEPVPNNLVRVEGRDFTRNGESKTTHVQFIPEPVYTAYLKMAKGMREDIGRPLLIESSYRSEAYQAITFLSILKLNMFDLAKTAKRAAIPGFSEHSTPSSLALDLLNVDGFPTDETPQDFEGTQEYDWLCKRANDFKFSMSYPKDNEYGVMFEPWHWRYVPNGPDRPGGRTTL